MNNIFRLAAIALALFVFAILLGHACGSNVQTVEEYQQECIESLNKELQDPKNPVIQRIENAHGTVKVTSAQVSYCKASTIDGTNNAGKNGSNISALQIQITTRWDGIFQKNGYTVFFMDFDTNHGKLNLRNAGITETNALVNTEDPDFWYGVGYLTGALLL